MRHAASPAVAPYPAEEQEEQEFQRCLEYLLQKLDVFSDRLVEALTDSLH